MDEVYTVEEVSSKLKIPEETIRQYLRKGILKGSRIGRYWRITEKDVEEFLEKNSNTNK